MNTSGFSGEQEQVTKRKAGSMRVRPKVESDKPQEPRVKVFGDMTVNELVNMGGDCDKCPLNGSVCYVQNLNYGICDFVGDSDSEILDQPVDGSNG